MENSTRPNVHFKLKMDGNKVIKLYIIQNKYIQGGAKKWNIHALRKYLLNTGFVSVDHWSRSY